MIRLCEMNAEALTVFMSTELKYCFRFLFGVPDGSGCFTDEDRILKFMQRAPYLHKVVDKTLIAANSGLTCDALEFVKKRLETLYGQITDDGYLYVPDEIGEGMLYLVINAFKCWDYDYVLTYPDAIGCVSNAAEPYYIGFHSRTQSERTKLIISELKCMAETDFADVTAELDSLPFFDAKEYSRAYCSLYVSKLSDPAWYSSELEGELPDEYKGDKDLIESLRECIPVHDMLFWDADFELYLVQIAAGLIPETKSLDGKGLTDITEGDAPARPCYVDRTVIDKSWGLKIL